jgi:hypothetical protein
LIQAVEIERLVWYPANVAKVAAHGVSQHEADDMIAENAWVVDIDEDYPDQIRVIGPSAPGRFITLALAPTPDPAAWRPVTGWPSTDEEIAYHREEYR